MKKKILLTFFIGAVVSLIMAFFYPQKLQANISHTGMGWLWGGGTEIDGAAPWDGMNTNFGWVSMNNINPELPVVAGEIEYGVSIPSGNGNLSGYAWSENIGWLSFNSSDLAGCAGATQAQRNGNSIQGWARILGIKTEAEKSPANAGGWSGCVKLSGTAQNGSSYGIQINTGVNPNALSGYAWSDELGWINFSQALVVVPPTIDSFASSTYPSGTIVLGSTDALPKDATLNWSVSNCGVGCSCVAGGDWSGNKAVSSGSESVSVSVASSNYVLTCTNAAGSDSKDITLSVGCYNNTCDYSDETCDAPFLATINGNSCPATPRCTVGSPTDCKRPDRNWREVAP